MPDVDVAERDTTAIVVAPPVEGSEPEVRRRVRRRTVIGVLAVAVLVAGGVAAAALDDGASPATDIRTKPADAAPTSPVDAAPEPAGAEVAAATEEAPPVAVAGPTAAAEIPTLPDTGPVQGRTGATVTWTGTELIQFGGVREADGTFPADQPIGAAYDPTTDTWRALPAPPLVPRADHVAVWTGTELVVWGGHNGSFVYALDGGAAYSPATDSWRVLAPSPLPADRYDGVWSGRELILVGGGEATVTGAAYEPATDTWRRIAYPPLALVEPDVTHRDGVVYVTGAARTGQISTGPARTMAYDIAADVWTDVAS